MFFLSKITEETVLYQLQINYCKMFCLSSWCKRYVNIFMRRNLYWMLSYFVFSIKLVTKMWICVWFLGSGSFVLHGTAIDCAMCLKIKGFQLACELSPGEKIELIIPPQNLLKHPVTRSSAQYAHTSQRFFTRFFYLNELAKEDLGLLQIEAIFYFHQPWIRISGICCISYTLCCLQFMWRKVLRESQPFRDPFPVTSP